MVWAYNGNTITVPTTNVAVKESLIMSTRNVQINYSASNGIRLMAPALCCYQQH